MKNNNSALILGTLFIVSIIIVYILFQYSTEKPNHQHNSFVREFPSEPIKLLGSLDVEYNSYYIAGATSKKIYFGNHTGVRHLLVSDLNLTDTQHVQINLEGIEDIEFRTIKVRVDSPYFYFSDGTVPVVFRGVLGNWKARRYTNDNAAYFMESVPISASSFAITTTSRKSKEFELGKTMSAPPYLIMAPEILEKQIDGKFCVDGMMHYSHDLNWLVYIYYYRNQFICADSNFNVVYRGSTIDTISQAKIKISEIKSEKSVTLSAPPLLVNRRSSVSGNLLFINSNLLSKNEDIVTFDGASVIDVYNLENGQYLYSFYLPDQSGQKMREFQVFGNMLIAKYDHHIHRYELNSEYFKKLNVTT